MNPADLGVFGGVAGVSLSHSSHVNFDVRCKSALASGSSRAQQDSSTCRWGTQPRPPRGPDGAVAINERCCFPAHLRREAAPPVVNKGRLQSSLEPSANINQRELTQLSGANESNYG